MCVAIFLNTRGRPIEPIVQSRMFKNPSSNGTLFFNLQRETSIDKFMRQISKRRNLFESNL